MSNAKTIEMARRILRAGNGGAYARIISGAIRSAMSERSISAFRKAIAEDKTEHLFVGLSGPVPIAA